MASTQHTQRITLNTPKRWRARRTKTVLLTILAGLFAITIIGLPVTGMILTYIMMRLGAHSLWKEMQGDN